MTDGLYGWPLRVRIACCIAPSSHAVAASATVRLVGARIVPFRRALVASALHPFAAARLGNVLRIFFSSRFEYTQASKLGEHLHAPPLLARQLRAWRTRMPGVARLPARSSVWPLGGLAITASFRFARPGSRVEKSQLALHG